MGKQQYVFAIFGNGNKPKYVTLHFDDIIDHSEYMKHLPNGNVLLEAVGFNDPAKSLEIETERHEVSFMNEDYKLTPTCIIFNMLKKY